MGWLYSQPFALITSVVVELCLILRSKKTVMLFKFKSSPACIRVWCDRLIHRWFDGSMMGPLGGRACSRYANAMRRLSVKHNTISAFTLCFGCYATFHVAEMHWRGKNLYLLYIWCSLGLWATTTTHNAMQKYCIRIDLGQCKLNTIIFKYFFITNFVKYISNNPTLFLPINDHSPLVTKLLKSPPASSCSCKSNCKLQFKFNYTNIHHICEYKIYTKKN